MMINPEQYRQAKAGRFLSKLPPEVEEEITLNVLTPRGRRFLPVGRVSGVRVICAGRCLVEIEELIRVEGFY